MEAGDEQLMLAYREGDAGAFEALYRRHKGGLFRFVLRSVRERAPAEELYQEIGPLIALGKRDQAITVWKRISEQFTTEAAAVARGWQLVQYGYEWTVTPIGGGCYRLEATASSGRCSMAFDLGDESRYLGVLTLATSAA